MGGRRGLVFSVLNATAKAAARAERARRQREIAERREARQRQRRFQAEKRFETSQLKEERQRYILERTGEAAEQNEDLEDRIEAIKGILRAALSTNSALSFDSLRMKNDITPFVPPDELTINPPAPQLAEFTARVKAPNWFQRLFPGSAKKYDNAISEVTKAHEAAYLEWSKDEEYRKRRLEEARADHERGNAARLKEIETRNAEVNELQKAYNDGDDEAVKMYVSMVLDRSEYPESFPRYFQIAYRRESKELVVDYELPSSDAIPAAAEYKYVKSKDVIEAKPRKAADTRNLYNDLVMSTALRTVHEIFNSDQAGHISTVTFSGYTHSVDAATGKDARPNLISLHVTKEKFGDIDLPRVDKAVCLKNLGAQVSQSLKEVQAVRPSRSRVSSAQLTRKEASISPSDPTAAQLTRKSTPVTPSCTSPDMVGWRERVDIQFDDSSKLEGRYVFVDIETTGLPRDRHARPEDLANWPHVVQLAWVLLDDEGKCIEFKERILKQNIRIPSDATAIHGITNAVMQASGVNPQAVLSEFLHALERTKIIVAHNIEFDVPILEAEFLRNGFQKQFTRMQKICTMIAGKDFCKLPGRNEDYKYPTLMELFQKCFYDYADSFNPVEYHHNALLDAGLTAKCFFKLKELNQIRE